MQTTTTDILSLPYDIIANISQYLDLVSNTSLMDTCRHFRYMYLSSTYIWRSIWFVLNHSTDLSRTYSSLRKLGDSNGLNQLVREVYMDGCDDAHFSPIIMLIKFPNLRVLSASNRPENTNLEVDIKVLQEMLREEKLKLGELHIEKLNIYNHQMDYETHLVTYQRLWNRLSKGSKVELDIRHCQHVIGSSIDQVNLDERIRQLAIEQSHSTGNKCQRIIKIGSKCWSCGFEFDSCWKCEPICKGCKLKRIPPLANDNQLKLKYKRHQFKQQIDNKADKDEFSVFN